MFTRLARSTHQKGIYQNSIIMFLNSIYHNGMVKTLQNVAK